MSTQEGAGARDAVEVRVPGDKSITHRALILAALAQGTSRLSGLLPAADAQATAGALRAMGIRLPVLPADGAPIAVAGHGLRGLAPPGGPIDCGNSGTTARLLLGLLAGYPFSVTLTGDPSLRARPMRRVTAPLSMMGASFEELGEPDRLPVRVTGGALHGVDYASPKASAQVKSALLLAGLAAGVPVRVSEPVVSRDHTERMLRGMGAEVVLEHERDGEPAVRLEPPWFIEPLHLDVPGDFSSAAYFLALALLSARGSLRVRCVGVNPTRTGLLGALRRMGTEVALEGPCDVYGEPIADLVAEPAPLRGTRVEGDEIPALIDEVPVLAVLAARAEGETVITGAEELRVKECDRIAALVHNLRALGVDADERPDGLTVRGTDAPLRGTVHTFGDHRIAMAFGVLAALPGNDVRVDDPDVVGISFPEYWQDLERAARALAS